MSSDVLPWLEYRWVFDFPTGMFRAVLERLRGTPARLEELTRGIPAAALTRHNAGRWSTQEHAGHLWAIEELWQTRIKECLRGVSALTPADMSNRATDDARYNERPIADVLAGFRVARGETLAMLDSLSTDDAGRVAHHPRLARAMRLVDLCFFAAEHDDHHLAVIHKFVEGGFGVTEPHRLPALGVIRGCLLGDT
jgi:uncharacterized damage-inducible protein DinB